jgi:hypothetical protein
MYVMICAALVLGGLAIAFSVYGLRAGDHELILKAWSLVVGGGMTVLVWAAGSVLEVLRRIRPDEKDSKDSVRYPVLAAPNRRATPRD